MTDRKLATLKALAELAASCRFRKGSLAVEVCGKMLPGVRSGSPAYQAVRRDLIALAKAGLAHAEEINGGVPFYVPSAEGYLAAGYTAEGTLPEAEAVPTVEEGEPRLGDALAEALAGAARYRRGRRVVADSREVPAVREGARWIAACLAHQRLGRFAVQADARGAMSSGSFCADCSSPSL